MRPACQRVGRVSKSCVTSDHSYNPWRPFIGDHEQDEEVRSVRAALGLLHIHLRDRRTCWGTADPRTLTMDPGSCTNCSARQMKGLELEQHLVGFRLATMSAVEYSVPFINRNCDWSNSAVTCTGLTLG